jgi:hypothetical protein
MNSPSGIFGIKSTGHRKSNQEAAVEKPSRTWLPAPSKAIQNMSHLADFFIGLYKV